MSVANKLLQRGVLLDAASMDAGDLDWSCLQAEIPQHQLHLIELQLLKGRLV